MVNLLLVVLISQLSTQATHTLALKENFGAVRASSFLTLVFIGLTFTLPFEIIPTLQAVFLGSSFVGMTDPKRLSRWQLFIASLIFCVNFQFLIGYLKVFGGALGLSAFIACLITYAIWIPVNRSRESKP
ncbi:MAG: hypothetical protein H0V66_14235 [Bdellovibrionales bacterium]|nr:hypothetical protein [Bdellovibrionales bacterium]